MNIETAIGKVIDTVRNRSPYKTGNLRHNAIRYVKMSDTHYKVYVDENIAPYMCYTNEPWINRGGKVNPNENWWDEAAASFANELSKTLKGELK